MTLTKAGDIASWVLSAIALPALGAAADNTPPRDAMVNMSMLCKISGVETIVASQRTARSACPGVKLCPAQETFHIVNAEGWRVQTGVLRYIRVAALTEGGKPWALTQEIEPGTGKYTRTQASAESKTTIVAHGNCASTNAPGPKDLFEKPRKAAPQSPDGKAGDASYLKSNWATSDSSPR